MKDEEEFGHENYDDNADVDSHLSHEYHDHQEHEYYESEKNIRLFMDNDGLL